jgi:hypothetical protein
VPSQATRQSVEGYRKISTQQTGHRVAQRRSIVLIKVATLGSDSHFRTSLLQRFADDLAQRGCDAVQDGALLPHALGLDVDLAGDARHLDLGILAGSVIEATSNPGVVEVEIGSQRRGRAPQVVGRERLKLKQRADARSLDRTIQVLGTRRAVDVAFR